MVQSDRYVYAAAGLVVALTLVSGPLVPFVDFTRAQADKTTIGEGHATVEVRSFPDRAAFVQGSYSSGSYYLEVPDATVRLENVTGQPMLIYKLRIPERGYTRGTTHFLSASQEGIYKVSLEQDAFAPYLIDQDQYEGELLLLVRGDGEDRVAARENVTVEVRE